MNSFFLEFWFGGVGGSLGFSFWCMLAGRICLGVFLALICWFIVSFYCLYFAALLFFFCCRSSSITVLLPLPFYFHYRSPSPAFLLSLPFFLHHSVFHTNIPLSSQACPIDAYSCITLLISFPPSTFIIRVLRPRHSAALSPMFFLPPARTDASSWRWGSTCFLPPPPPPGGG